VIGGKWKMPILWRIRERPLRYTDLRESLNEHAYKPVTHAMLTQQLKQLEESGLITRTVYAEAPPRVEYLITPLGAGVIPVINAFAFGDATRVRDFRQRNPAPRIRGGAGKRIYFNAARFAPKLMWKGSPSSTSAGTDFTPAFSASATRPFSRPR